MSTPDRLLQAQATLRDELIDAGHLIPTSVPGLYGRSGEFEAIIDGINSVASKAGAYLGSDVYRFPPVFPRTSFESTGYLSSFPHLTGAISTFLGDNKQHAALLAARESGQAWDSYLSPTETMLVSAACHPAYAMLTGTLPAQGRTLDIYGYCFRHEPAVDPARMQAFRMREFVRVGSEDAAKSHRAEWIGRGMELLTSLGLDAESVAANDPFFGRAGRILAASQRADDLKTELVVRIYGDADSGTAVVSCNRHGTHFGEKFGIHTVDGEVAHSACVGFGMERIALALLRAHGLNPRQWSTTLRLALNLS